MVKVSETAAQAGTTPAKLIDTTTSDVSSSLEKMSANIPSGATESSDPTEPVDDNPTVASDSDEQAPDVDAETEAVRVADEEQQEDNASTEELHPSLTTSAEVVDEPVALALPPPSTTIPPVVLSTATIAVVAPTARPPPPVLAAPVHVCKTYAPPPPPPTVHLTTMPPPPLPHVQHQHHQQHQHQAQQLQQQQHHTSHQSQPIYVTATRQYLTAHQPPGGPPIQLCGPPVPPPPPHGHQWPIVEPVFHFGPGFERSPPYCPTHTPATAQSANEHVVLFHVNVGVSVTFVINGVQEVIHGPTTVPMVSQGGSPPVPLNVPVPNGHLIHQMVDEQGQLRHVFLSTAHQPPPPPLPAQTVGVPGVQAHSHYIANNGQPHYYTLPAGPPGTGPPHYHLPPGAHHLHQPPPPSAMSAHLQQHSPSPPSAASQQQPPTSAAAAAAAAAAYHKDERSQRQHNKLLRKLDAKNRENQQQAQRKGGAQQPPPHILLHINHSNGLHHHNSNSSSGGNNHHQQQHSNNSTGNTAGGGMHNNHTAQNNHHVHLQQLHQQQHQQQHPHQQHLNHNVIHHHNNHHHIHQQQQALHQQQPPPSLHPHSQLHASHPAHHHHHLHVVGSAPPSPHNGGGNGGTHSSTTPTSGAASTASYDEDTSSLATTDDDDETLALQEHLSSVPPPVVSEVTSRTALVQWSAPQPPSEPPSPTTVSPPSPTPSPSPPPSGTTSTAVVPTSTDPTPATVAAVTAPPTPILNARDLRYEVLLSDRGKEGKYKIIFKGASLTCRIRDLRPGQEYSVCLVVHLHNVHGSASEAAVFTTPGCEPDAPLPPKCIARTKNSLQLRWNAPLDNGAHIQQYLLEYDEGKTGRAAELVDPDDDAAVNDDLVVAPAPAVIPFVEIIRMKGKQYSLSKLQPSTWYQFRLAAINEFGHSTYSDPVAYATAGNVPPPMPAPQVHPAVTTCSHLRITWTRRPTDDDYVLQIADPGTGHGFLTCYTGRDTQHDCTQLNRATAYQFRMRAQNESGVSTWSEILTASTLPERPGRPGRPAVKGRTHSTHFKARWDAPSDNGGAPVRLYTLQMAAAEANTINAATTATSTMSTVYTGPDTEAQCDGLQPGRVYQLRVCCEGPGGISVFSDSALITTEAVVPDAPARPQCTHPPGPYAAALRWMLPEWQGGAAVTEFELQLLALAASAEGNDPAVPVSVYRGKEPQCCVRELQPGVAYAAQVRAFNRIGAGGWSEALHFSAGAAAPFAPEQPSVEIATVGGHVTVTWREPIANGSPILEYQLEAAAWPSSSDNSTDDLSTSQAPRAEHFHACYTGLAPTADVRHLLPYTRYAFRVAARNAAGTSLYSTVASVRTPPTVPAAPHIEHHQATADSIRLQWRAAEANGSPVLYYIVEDATTTTTASTASTTAARSQSQRTADAQPEWTVRQLRPETVYRYRVQAVNACGPGPFSNAVRVQTRALPPRAPRLECVQPQAHNALKLRWSDGKNVDFTRFVLDMWNARAGEFQTVYAGKLMTFKVGKLQEQQAYVFRICAESDAAGVGDWSEEYVFRTSAAVPSSVRPPRCTDGGCVQQQQQQDGETELSSALVKSEWVAAVHVEWQHSRNTFADPVEYVLQMHGPRATEFKQIYRGRDNHHRVQGLQPGHEYTFRVCPVRCATVKRNRAAAAASKRQSAVDVSPLRNGGVDHLNNGASAAAIGHDGFTTTVTNTTTETKVPAHSSADTDASTDEDDDDDDQMHTTVDHFGVFSAAVRHTPALPANNSGTALADTVDGAHATGVMSTAGGGGDRTDAGLRAWLRWTVRRFWQHCRSDDRLPETEHAVFMMILMLLFCVLCTGTLKYFFVKSSAKVV